MRREAPAGARILCFTVPNPTLRLEPWSDIAQHAFQVELVLESMTTLRTNEGCVLRIEVKVQPDVVDSGYGNTLLALRGWLKLAESTHQNAGIEIPMQPHVVNYPYIEVPMTLRDLAYADLRRAGGEVHCLLTLTGLANIPYKSPPRYEGSDIPPWATVGVRDNGTGVTFTIGREQWLNMLAGAGFERTRLVELPVASGAVGPKWAECMRLLGRATSELAANQSEAAIATCRQVVEGLGVVFAQQWGVQLQPGKSSERFKELQGRMGSAWPDDEEAGELLTALYGAVWSWTSPGHHYGSRVPRREEAAFAVGLTADLLTHAGHLIEAHPAPLKQPARTSLPSDGSQK